MVGDTIVLRTDEPTTGVGRPLKRVRVRVNDIIVPIGDIQFLDNQIFVTLEDAVAKTDIITIQYNPELQRPVADGIIALDNLEELKPFLLGVNIVTVGQVAAPAQIGVLSSGASAGQVQIFTTLSAILFGVKQVNAFVGVFFRSSGQVVVAGSIGATSEMNGQIIIGGRITVKQNGIVQEIASVEVKQNAVVQVPASIGLVLPGVGQVQSGASAGVKQNGVVQAAAVIVAKQNGVVQVASSIAAKQNSEVQIAASVQAVVAPKIDAISSVAQDGVDPMVLSHTTAPGSDRAMYIFVSLPNHAIGFEDIPIKYGASQFFTQVGTGADHPTSTSPRVGIWRLLAPAVGTAIVSVTIDGVNNQGGVLAVVTLTGVNQSTPDGGLATATGSDAAPTVVVTSAKGELVIDAVSTKNEVVTGVGSGQTQRWNTGIDTAEGAGSTEPGAASVTMDWALGLSADWAHAAVSIKPV